MATLEGRSPHARVLGKVGRLAGALVLAALIGYPIADRRGPILGLVAFLVYGALLGFAAWRSFADMRRWSAEHVVLDALGLVPLVFVALLLIPGLAWWAAALIALAAGMVFVPLVVRPRGTA